LFEVEAGKLCCSNNCVTGAAAARVRAGCSLHRSTCRSVLAAVRRNLVFCLFLFFCFYEVGGV